MKPSRKRRPESQDRRRKRNRALRWKPLLETLQPRIPFAGLLVNEALGDIDQLGVALPSIVDDGYGKLAIDRVLPPAAKPGPTGAPLPLAAPVPVADLAELNSNPGAAATVFLDFDGHTETTWGSFSNVVIPIFDTDNDITTFSDAEQAIVTEVWQRVSEDFSPFDINVTTVEPASFADGVAIRVSIGGDGAWVGQTVGGVAYLDAFTNSLPNTVFVFPDNLSDSATNIAEASSHESGHAFGLEHQSLYSGTTLVEEYHPGNAVWAPIMGNSYSAAQTLWHNGPTHESSTSLQDDLAVLSRAENGFGYRTDDHGSTFGDAESLATGSVNQSGIIEQMTDADYFTFTTLADGTVSLNAATATVGANLDISLELYSSTEVLLASDDPSSSLTASLSESLTAGTYYVVVSSSGDYGEVGQYTITGTIPDNSPPVLATISDQTMVHNVDTLDITLSATDANGDTITFSAVAETYDATAAAAYQLDQTHGLFASSSEFLNFRGLNEKYLQGAGENWFYVLPTGAVYQWGGSVAASTLLGTLSADYYNDLSLLYDATPQPYESFSGSVSVSGSTLTIDPDAGVTGTFGITVTASDGSVTDTQTFALNITNEAPVLSSVADQTLAHNVDTLAVTVSATDADSDTVTYSATAGQVDAAESAAYQLDQIYDFYTNTEEFLNFRGLSEKYFRGANDAWFYVLPTGAVYRWAGTVASSPLLGTTDSTFYGDLSKFVDVTAPVVQSLSSVTATFSGSTLTIDPDLSVVGSFTVTLTATDGIATDTESFDVTVTNSAPVLTAVSDQTLSHSVDTLDVTLSATDADGDTITYSATAGQVDATALLAYQLDQAHDFYAASDEFLNFGGLSEKYFRGDGTGWFYILPTGAVYDFASPIGNSTLLGTLDSSYYADLSTLFDVSAPGSGDPVDVSATISGTTLTLNPGATFVGLATITVTASDGGESSSITFDLDVTNSAPVLSAIADQTHSYATDTLDITLSATDADGDTLTYAATSSEANVTASVSGSTLTLDPASAFRGDATITVTADDGFAQDTLSFVISVSNSAPVITTISDQTIAHTTDTLDVTITATDADSDTLTISATSSEPNVTASVSGTTLTLDPAALYSGTATITVTADDGTNQTTSTFALNVTNQAPVLGTLNNQTISHNLDTLDVTLSATDGDSDTLTYAATAGRQNPTALLAYQLDQSLDFFAATDEFENFRGEDEKYFRGDTDGWFYILPTGAIYRFGSTIADSTLLGTLDSTYHDDLTNLIDVTEPAATDPVAVTLSVTGSTLTIDPNVSFVGSFTVTVTATDGIATDTATFAGTVTNSAPALSNISNQTMSHTTDTLDVTVAATDADSDTLTYTAASSESGVTATMSGTTLTLDPASSFSGDTTITVTVSDGAEQDSKSFVLSVTNATPTITTIADQTIAHTTDTLDVTVTTADADGDTVTISATSSEPNVTVSASGSTVTLDPAALFAGTATITVTADDGNTQSTETFVLNVTNQAPVIGAISDQTITHNLDTYDVTLSITDGNSDTVTLSATAGRQNPIALLAYQLDQTHDFFAAEDEFLNFNGQNEKYFRGDTDQWFYILPSGAVYSHGATFGSSTLLGTLSASYYSDLTTLFDVTEPGATESVSVAPSFSGSTLTLDPDASFTGQFTVTVTATDGIDTATATFDATVTNSAPDLAAILDQTMSHTTDTLDVTLSSTDADSDTLTYAVTSSESTVTASVSGTTVTLDPASSFLGDATITVTATDGAASDTETFVLTVTNDAPVLTTISDQTMSYATDTLDVTIAATDADSDTITYSVASSQSGVTASISGTTLTLDPASNFLGDSTITVTADDGIAQTSTTFVLSVTNSTPVLSAVSDQTIAHTTDTLDITLSATDADSDTVTFAATSSVANVTASVTGSTLTLDPAALYAGTATITVTADDGNSQATQTFALNVTNQAPVVATIADQTLVHNVDTLDVTISATDGNSDTLIYTATSSQAGVATSVSGTTLTLDPSSSFLGDATITVTADDGIEQHSVTFVLSVTNQTPVVSAISDQTMSHTTDTLDVTISATDGDSDTLTYTVASSESAVTTSLSGTTITLDPAASFLGDATITVTATDGHASHSVTFGLSVTNATPVLSTVSDQTLVHNVDTLDITLSATDADSDTVTYSATSSASGVTASVSGATLTLDPATSFLGDATITVTADDGIAQSSLSFTLSVTNTNPVLNAISDQTIAHTTDTLDITLSASDADSDTLTYSVTSSEANVTASVTGTTVTLDPAALYAGTATITVTAADTHASATQTFTLNVTNAAPVLSTVSDQSMSYATDTLDVTLSATDGNSDTVTFSATSSQSAVTATTSGSTLTLDPDASFRGDSTITVTATDGIEQVTQTFVLTVTNSTPVLSTVSDQTISHATDTLDITLSATDADSDTVTYSAVSSESQVTVSVSGAVLTLDPAALYTGTATITVTAADAENQTTQTFDLTVTNQAPVLTTISDQTISHNTDTLDITLSASDGDSDTLTLGVTAAYFDPVEVLAHQLDQAHDFFAATSENENLLGLSEKWFRGDTTAWYYILPTGEIFLWGGSIGSSTSQGTLNSTYHSDLTNLFDVAAPTSSSVAATTSITGSTLTVDPDITFVGSFTITVTATDGIAQDSESFDFTVTNSAPSLTAVSDQQISYTTDTLDVTLSASDGDGDTVTLSVASSSTDVTASLSGSTLTLDPASSFRGDATLTITATDGAETDTETFVLSVTNSTPAITSISDQTIAHTTDTLDITIAATDADSDTITLSASSSEPNVTASLTGTTLTLDPAALFSGTATITVTADDGNTQATETFTLTVTNQAPVIGSISDQTITHNQDTLDVTLAATDGNSDTVTFTATGTQQNQIALAAYQLDQTHDFFAADDEFLNFRGQNEKYFRGDTTAWFYILPTGAVYQFGTTIADSTLVGTLDSSYYSDVSQLFNVTSPPATDPASATLTVSGSTLTIDPPASFVGTFTVTVTGTDGIDTDTATFDVTVTNSAPVLGAINDQTMSHNTDTLDVTLSVTDGDGDTLTYTVTSSESGVTGSVSGTTLTLDPASNFLGDTTITVTASDGAVQDSQTFTLSVTNDAPVITAIADQNHSYATDTLDITLAATDADSDTVTFTATSSSSSVTASVSGTTLTLDPASNFLGDATITVTADDGIAQTSTSFVISVSNSTPDLTAPSDQTIAHTTDTLDITLTATDADSDTLTLTATSSNASVTASITGTTLTLDPAALFTGTSTITVTADDGTNQDTETFTLTVTNQAPVLASIADQTLAHNVDTLDVTLSATDGDSDTVTFAATAARQNPIAVAAYQLDQTHDFYAADDEYLNFRGLNEKYLRGSGQGWFYILPNGALYEWGGTIASSTLQGTLDSTYYADLSLLFDMAVPSSTDPVSASVSISGSTLTIDPDISVVGDFVVTVTATDGIEQVTETFTVTVNNTAPALTAIADQTMSHSTSSLDVTLAATDADGDTVTYSAVSSNSSVTVSVSGSTLTLDPAASFVGDVTITVTASDGASTDVESFQLAVTNAAPTITSIADQTMVTTTDTLDVTVTTSDADGDSVTLSATAVEIDLINQAAYTLDQTYDFSPDVDEFLNFRGSNEKYFRGAAEEWFFILPTGAVYEFGTTIADSTLLDTLDSTYYSDLTTLYDVTLQQTTVAVGLSFTGSVLTIDPTNSYTGTMQITVTATDGIASSTETFNLGVAAAGPLPSGAVVDGRFVADTADEKEEDRRKKQPLEVVPGTRDSLFANLGNSQDAVDRSTLSDRDLRELTSDGDGLDALEEVLAEWQDG